MGFWNRVFGGSDKESTENKPAQPQQFADPEDYSAVLMEKAAEETLAEEVPMEKLPVEEMPAVTVTDSRKVFDWFRQICAIPHGSYHTKEISDFLVQFARDRGFVWEQDEADNVIIYCPASPGCELAQPLILQGHMDMVLEKEGEDSSKDDKFRLLAMKKRIHRLKHQSKKVILISKKVLDLNTIPLENIIYLKNI